MARITAKSIKAVKDNVKISDVFEWLGSKVITRGRNTMAFCPFCEDFNSRTPGCSLNDNSGLFHCFVCGKGGDLITAVQDHEECSFPEAVELIASQFNIPLEYEASSDPEGESRRKRYVSVLERALEDFHNQKSDPHWIQFVRDRELSDDAVSRFEMGLSLMSESRRLVADLLKEFSEEDLVNSGLCYRNEDTGEIVLRFKNRAIYPIRTAPGTLIGFGGRDLTGKSNAKYINSPESELFKKRNVLYGINLARRAISKSKRVIVCEGYMDTIALQTHGIEESVGAMGTALTDYNLKYLSNFADVIYISLDADEAGINAAMKTADVIPRNFASSVRVLTMPSVTVNDDEELKAACGDKLYAETQRQYDGEIPYPVSVPIAKDPDEFFNERHKTLRDFEKVVDEADDLFLFCAMHVAERTVAALDKEMGRERPDASQIAKLKQHAYKEVSSFVVKHYDKMNIYQRQNIANWMIESLRLIDTFEKMETDWRRAAQMSGGRSSYSKVTETTAVPNPVFESASTKEEDLLISTLYYHPETRETIKQNIEDLKLVFTSHVRESIFDKLSEGFSKNMDVNAIATDFSEDETKELARITMSGDAMPDQLSDETIISICRDVECRALENKIEAETNSPSPDLMAIIAMKTKLASLR